MERLILIRLSKITYEDFISFFKIKRFDPDRINVQPSWSRDGYTHDDFWEATKYKVFDLNHNLMGKFEFTQFSDFSTISYYIENKQKNHKDAFLEYINDTIEEMKLVGFIILDIHEFEEATIDLENDKSDDTSEEISTQANNPWEQIDESENLKEMVRLIHEGLSPEEIAKELSYATTTIYKRSSELRSEHGCKIVPYFQKWRKCED